MKTSEFKLKLDLRQVSVFEAWTKELAWVWNLGLELLLESHQHKYYEWMLKSAEKQGIDLEGIDLCYLEFPRQSAWGCNGSMPSHLLERLEGSLESLQKSKTDKFFFSITTPRCRIAGGRDDEYYPCLPEKLRPSRLSGKSVSGYLTKGCCDAIRQSFGLDPLSVPSKFIQGVLAKLEDAWKAYCNTKLPQRHKPKFKSFKDLDYLYLKQPESIKLIYGQPGQPDAIQLPGVELVGTFRLVNKGFSSRLHKISESEPRQAQITRKASGFYLTLTLATPKEAELTGLRAKLKKTPKTNQAQKDTLNAQISELQEIVDCQHYLPSSDLTVGIDPGVAHALTTDQGTHYPPSSALNRYKKRLKRLQRKASRQQKNSKSQKDTYKKIALTWEKISRSRSAFNHKISTKIVRQYGAIAFEDTQIQNLTKAPAPKLREDGKGYAPNKAKAKAALTQKLTNVAIGDLRTKIEQKAKFAGREFNRPNPHRSSQLCHACGELGDRRSQSEFICLNAACVLHQLVQNADTNAARNLLLRGKSNFARSYRAWAWEVKRDDQVASPERGTTGNPGETRSHCGAPPETKLLDLSSSGIPESEYDSQSLFPSNLPIIRGSGGVDSCNSLDALQPLPINELGSCSDENSRAPCAPRLSGNSEKKKRRSSQKLQGSAHTSPESYTQLDFWDDAGTT